MINRILRILLTNRFILISLFILFSLILILQIHNTHVFNTSRGFDEAGHSQYISFFQTQNRVPLANEGWELYQPPFYYYIASLLPTMYAVKWLGFSFWLLLSAATFFFLKRVYRSEIIAGIGTIILSSLPVVLYMTPTISNEFTSSVFISISFIFYISIFLKKPSYKNSIILGLLVSLSLLTKATAFLLCISILGDLFFNRKIRKKLKIISIYLLVVLFVAGWYYIRNVIIFHNPFVTSVDFPQYKIEQPPGYRDINFYINLKPFITMDLYKAHYDSFISGTYFSWYFDGHTVMAKPQEYSKAGIALIIWSLPILFLFFKGYWSSITNITNKNRVFILYVPLLIFAYILYTIKLPFYSTVKGSFILSAVIPWIYFVMEGSKKLKKYYGLMIIYLLILIVLILKNFWI